MPAVIGALRAELSASIAQFQADMGKAAAIVEGFGKKAFAVGSQLNKAGQGMFRSVTVPVLALGFAVGKTAGDFEAGMNRVAAATQAPADQIEELRQQALKLGPEMGIGPSKAAEAFENLAKNGKSATDILEGAGRATMLLARSTGGDLAPAADLASDIMAQFEKRAAEMGDVVDQVNGTLITSKLDFDNYRMALGQVGGVAGGMNIPFEDLNAALAATSNLFSSGSDAGTSFKTFLQRLTPQSKEAAAMIDALNLEFYDAQGNMKSLAEIAGELQRGFAGLTEEAKNKALTTIFGSDAIRTAIGLIKTGTQGINDLKATIGNTSAEDQMAAKVKGINGAMAVLSAQLQALAIAIADSGFIQFITDAVKGLTDWVVWMKNTNPELFKLGTQIALVAAAIGPFAIALGAIATTFGVLSTVIRVAVIPALWAFFRHPVIVAGALLGLGVAALIIYFKDLVEWIKEACDWLARMFLLATNPAIGIAIEANRQKAKAAFNGIVQEAINAADKVAAAVAAKPIESLPMVAPALKLAPIATPKKTLEDLEGELGGGGGAAKAVQDFSMQIRSLGEDVANLTRGELGGLAGRLREIDDQFANTRQSITDQIAEIKKLGASAPNAASDLGQLEKMLASLEAGHKAATAAAKEQYAAEKKLADLRAQGDQLELSQKIEQLRGDRGDNGIMSESMRRLQETNAALDRERLKAATDLQAMEVERAAAAKVHDEDAVARMTALIALQSQYYGLLETTTAAQLESAARQQEAWTNFEKDLSDELSNSIMDWKFSLEDISNIFRQLAKDLFIKPFMDSVTAGLGGFLKGFAGGFASGGTIPRGQWGVIGENGPEVARAHAGGIDIEPMPRNMGGGNTYLTQNFTTPNPDAFRASRRQVGRMTREALGSA